MYGRLDIESSEKVYELSEENYNLVVVIIAVMLKIDFVSIGRREYSAFNLTTK